MNFGRKVLSTKFYNLGKGEKGKGFKKCDFLPKARTWFFLTFLIKWSNQGVLSRFQYPWGKLVNDLGKCEGELVMPRLSRSKENCCALVIEVNSTL